MGAQTNWRVNLKECILTEMGTQAEHIRLLTDHKLSREVGCLQTGRSYHLTNLESVVFV